jgi:hypothetical protein
MVPYSLIRFLLFFDCNVNVILLLSKIPFLSLYNVDEKLNVFFQINLLPSIFTDSVTSLMFPLLNDIYFFGYFFFY